jgi:hypothetical protein
MFRRSRYSSDVSFDSLRVKLAEERALSDLLLSALTLSVDSPEYESRVVEAINAYVRSRYSPIIGK